MLQLRCGELECFNELKLLSDGPISSVRQRKPSEALIYQGQPSFMAPVGNNAALSAADDALARLYGSFRAECIVSADKLGDFPATKTVDGVIVDHSDGLHEGITNGWADKIEAALFQIFAHQTGRRGLRRNIGKARPHVVLGRAVNVTPEKRVK